MKTIQSMHRILTVGALLLTIAAVAVAHEGMDIPLADHNRKSPLQKTSQNTLAGAAVYREQCSGCHGPLGTPTKKFKNLKMQPSVLTTQSIQQHHTDGDLFYIVSHGLKGGMPNFTDDLTETERWQAVMFVRRLPKDAQKYLDQLPPETAK